MKNLQEIMNEMNNLSEQIAVTLNDEEVNLSPETIETIETTENVETTEAAEATPSDLLDASPLHGSNCDYKDHYVDFCCTVNLPEPFQPYYPIYPKIIYDLSCLKVIVEDCCKDIKIGWDKLSVPVYNIRVVGCIPFIVNIPLKHDSPTTCVKSYDNTVSACCSGSVCVDNVIDQVCSERAALLASGKVQLNCYTVEVKDLHAYKDNCAVKVTGKFKLPYA